MTAKIFSNDFNRLIAAVKAFVGGRGHTNLSGWSLMPPRAA